MTFPYKVTVTGRDNDMSVVIRPQPVAIKDELIPVVAGRFQKALMANNVKNTMFGRKKLKAELEHILLDFHNQGIIKPKDEK